MSHDTSYETIPYENYAFPGTHPNRLAGWLRLAGGDPPPPAGARVLELGCAAGANLLPMGVELPGAQFVGADLSPGQIAAGTALRQRAGIGNVELRCANVMDIDDSWGEFDYIVMHGLYSYVPPAVQDRLLAICRDRLAANGGAYIGFNVLPGWHFNASVRQMLIAHTASETNVARRPARARELLAMLAEHAPPDARGQQLRELHQRLAERPDAYLFHEYLEDENRPIAFADFMARAGACGLTYVTDSAPMPVVPGLLPPPAAAALESLSGGDWLRREQYFDFVTGRTLRCAVLAREGGGAGPLVHDERIDAVHIGLVVRPDGPATTLLGAIDQPQVLADGRRIRLNGSNPVYRAAFGLLAQASPQALPFDHLLAEARRLANSANSLEADRSQLRAELRAAFIHGVAEPLAEPWRCAREVPGRPAVSALAREQAAAGQGIATLLHKQLFPPPKVRELIALMDGTRTVDALLAHASAGRQAADRDSLVKDFRGVLAYLRGHALFAAA